MRQCARGSGRDRRGSCRDRGTWSGSASTLGAYVAGLIVLFLLLPHFFQLSTLVYVFGEAIISCFLLAFPLSLGFAILRYRLYDIDVLINRTVVYSLLTASLGLIYFKAFPACA